MNYFIKLTNLEEFFLHHWSRPIHVLPTTYNVKSSSSASIFVKSFAHIHCLPWFCSGVFIYPKINLKTKSTTWKFKKLEIRSKKKELTICISFRKTWKTMRQFKILFENLLAISIRNLWHKFNCNIFHCPQFIFVDVNKF